MATEQKHAILMGATGLTGKKLLKLLLEDQRYARVTVLGRNRVGFTHPKLEEHLVDLKDPATYRQYLQGQELFCCVGTTRKRTPNKLKYREVDYGIPVKAAHECQAEGIPTFLVISALGASPNSRMFYNRVKGEMEADVLEHGLPKTHILQPALLAGKRKERRPGEWIARQLFKVMNLVLVGPLDKYRSIRPITVARAMLWLANNPCKAQRIPSDEIRRIAAKTR